MNATAKHVAVIGGGLAGLSAACALAGAGVWVSLFERRPYLGGRASSYEHPGTGETIDNCQHVLLGCCTNLIDFYQRLGVAHEITWFDSLNFITSGGKCSVLAPSALLPAPFHSTASFLCAHFLDLASKDAIARALLRLIPGLPPRTEEDFLSWLLRQGQTSQAVERFWKPVIVSALNEDLDRVSVYYAAQVFRESFLKSAAAGAMGVPRIPLTQLYGASSGYITERTGQVHTRASVQPLALETSSAGPQVTLQTPQGPASFDAVILAVPFESAAALLPQCAESHPLRAQLARFQHSPITGIHLWFDRRITNLPHAVLLDRTIQWLFHKSLLQPQRGETGSYVELVVSASKSLVEMQRQEIIDLAVKELTEFFPAVRSAALTKATVVKEVRATFSVQPGCDSFRPAARTPWPQIFLAGDYTATGWPATMEGAVRSGYLAAEAVTAFLGSPARFLVPDLRAHGLMRLFDREH